MYIDKTEYIYNLIKETSGCFFFSRPRRFGKSLTISTLKAVFQGKKELFAGLAISKKDYDWQEYPIIHLDMGSCSAKNAEDLENFLVTRIKSIANDLNILLANNYSGLMFQDLITQLSPNDKKVVILVDEYDKPILGNIKNPQADKILQVLKGFYSVIKACENYERFVFITGVSKFCHVSIFSDLNNLTDITMHSDYATMLGYTQGELECYFGGRITDISVKLGLPIEELKSEIKEWYNGFRFEEESDTVYNPVSVSNFFYNGGKFKNYWFETGTPSFLMELTKEKDFNFEKAMSKPVTNVVFSSFEIDSIDPLSLLLQTGYVTIKSTETILNRTWYHLDFPNAEVAESFSTYLLNSYVGKTQREVTGFAAELTFAFMKDDLPEARKQLEAFFAGIPYTIHKKSEATFQSIFFAIFRLLNFNIIAELCTNDGRSDAVIETEKYIYLFEFKLNQDEMALSQIKEKKYFKPYLCSKKKITLIGINFDSSKGQIINWEDEILKDN